MWGNIFGQKLVSELANIPNFTKIVWQAICENAYPRGYTKSTVSGSTSETYNRLTA